MDILHLPYIKEIVVFLSFAVFVTPIFRALKLSTALGYFVSGIIIGPYSLGLIDDIESVSQFAEFGVLFLMFIIGLELPLERFKVMRKWVFGLGLMQVFVTSLVFTGLCLVLELPLSQSIIIGSALALSSTALVLQMLAEKNQLSTKAGRASFGVLLFQDIAVLPILALIPLFVIQEETQSSSIEAFVFGVGQSILAIAMVIIVGKIVLRPLFRFIDKNSSDDIFTACTILVILGVSIITAKQGLSMALGAFLSGMLIAETEFKAKVEKNIIPFQGLLLGLFFISVGMKINLTILLDNIALIAKLTLLLMMIKASILLLLCWSLGLNISASIKTSLMLAQGGEFAFVILGQTSGIISEDLTQIIMLVVALSMALTPFIMLIAEYYTKNLQQTDISRDYLLTDIANRTKGVKDHVIIIGFGRIGKSLASILEQKGVPYIILDGDFAHVKDCQKEGMPIYHGKAHDIDLLDALNAYQAKGVILTMKDISRYTNIIERIAISFPNLFIETRCYDSKDAEKHINLGASCSFPDQSGVAIQMCNRMIQHISDSNKVDN